MTEDPTDSSMPITKMILLDQLKRYNENIKEWVNDKLFKINNEQHDWINNTFLPIENAHNIIGDLFGIGYVWISYTNTSPASLVGGTWTPITGRFPYFNAGNSTGGANSQTLSIAQMPAHKHKLGLQYGTDWVEDSWNWSVSSSGMYVSEAETESVGGGQPYNNMPAYQTLYAWRRVS